MAAAASSLDREGAVEPELHALSLPAAPSSVDRVGRPVDLEQHWQATSTVPHLRRNAAVAVVE
jgi:hypothetical protein